MIPKPVSLLAHQLATDKTSNMATQVPPSTKPTPDQFKPLPPPAELYEPEDYRETFAVHKDHKGISKVC